MSHVNSKSASEALIPLTTRIYPLLRWPYIDRIVIELMAINNDTKGLFGKNSIAYLQLTPLFILLTLAVAGIYTDNLFVASVFPMFFLVAVAQRYIHLSDALNVIGRLQEVKDAINNCLNILHSENYSIAQYDADFLQPLLVDYLKRQKKLSGKEFLNIYIQLRSASRHEFRSMKEKNSPLLMDKKNEFNSIFSRPNELEPPRSSSVLSILNEDHSIDDEIVSKVSAVKTVLSEIDGVILERPSKTASSSLSNVELRSSVIAKISSGSPPIVLGGGDENFVGNVNAQEIGDNFPVDVPDTNLVEKTNDIERDYNSSDSLDSDPVEELDIQEDFTFSGDQMSLEQGDGEEYIFDGSDFSEDFPGEDGDDFSSGGSEYDDEEMIRMINEIEKDN